MVLLFPKKDIAQPPFHLSEGMSSFTIVITVGLITIVTVIILRILNKRLIKIEDESNVTENIINDDDYEYYLKTNVLDDIEENISEYNISQKEAKKRAYSFLYLGFLIATIGLIIFLFLIIVPISYFFNLYSSSEISNIALLFISKFSVFIFIESIAFYLFRQYRLNMDDYKYFDSLKRQIIGNKILFKIKHQYPEAYNDLKIDMKLFDNPDKLQNGETTISVKNRRLTQNDDVFINKLTESILNKLGK